jgi:hypothetical protein
VARSALALDLHRPSHQRLIVALFLTVAFPLSVVGAIGVFLALL